MHSKQLKQGVRLALDTMGMRGPVTRREVAEEALNHLPSSYWALADVGDAKLHYLIDAVTELMREPLSQDYIDQHLPHVPEKFRHLLYETPSFICTNRRGGPKSQHVMSFKATRDDWASYIKLKTALIDHTTRKRDGDREILDMLEMLGVQTLEELCTTAPTTPTRPTSHYGARP